VEVVDDTLTGEVLLDEALKMMKQEKMSISDWIDLMSGRFLQIPTNPHHTDFAELRGTWLDRQANNNQERHGTSSRWATN
jgi:hypothetical protein